MPRLALTEWLVFAALAAALAITNVYTTLLTGWADGGSLLAVIAAVVILRAAGRQTSIRALNLGQTMASAGAAVGFAVAAYAAIRMADPDFSISTGNLALLFLATSIAGTLIGAALRPAMVRYQFPSGTACAAIQTSVSRDGGDRGSLRLLSVSGAIAAAWTAVVKLGLAGRVALPISPDPLFLGLGLVVGPRIAAGLLIGSISGAWLLPGLLGAGGVPEAAFDHWKTWLAIATLALPTGAGVIAARRWREPPVVPPGFEPGPPRPASRSQRRAAAAGLAVSLAIAVALTAVAFEVSWIWAVIAALAAGPLCLINGRVAADTDINPVLLVVIAALTGFALIGGMTAVMLLGLALIGSTAVGVAVDTMQDHRTGYLLDQNPHHQTAAQIAGVVVGVAASVPFITALDRSLGFGSAALPAPGPKIYTTIATALAGDVDLSGSLLLAIAAVSAIAAVIAVLGVWPRTARFIPSLFGAGIGLLLPLDMTGAIAVGAIVGWGISRASADPERSKRSQILVGSAAFAASAVVSAVLLAV